MKDTQKLADLPPASAAAPDLPAQIGGFAVRRILGQGGMGRVYACHDAALDREVAIKVLLKELAVQEDMSERFLREARAMAKVRSPHVVVVYQVGTDESGPFLVMEVLDGQDLASKIKADGPLPLADACRFTLEAASGLATASKAGLVHRDVKPENLFLTSAGVKLTDFGLARPLDGSENLTQAGLVVGSPHYIAPELARGQEASTQSDLYALGATLFEMLAGKPPYAGATAIEIITAHLMHDVPDIKQERSEVPTDLADLVARLLAKDPTDRVGSYAAVKAVVERVLASLDRDLGPSTSTAAAADKASPGSASPGSATQILGGGGGLDTSATASIDGARLPVRNSGVLPSVKTETLAVMFTDLAGYTARTGTQSREEAAYWLELHDALLKPVFRAFKGNVIKTIGDAFLVTFKSPTDAVHCGCAIQDRLFAHNASASDADRIDVRVAVSVGEVRMRKGDVLGEPVNLAARLEGMAEKGEVLFSDAVYATMNTAEVTSDDRGEHSLKGIKRKVRVYAARRSEDATQPPFGGAALAQVNDGGLLPALDKARRKIAGALDQVSEGLTDVAQRSGGLDKRKLGLAAAAMFGTIFLIVGGVVLVDSLGSNDDDPIDEWSIEELAAFLPDKNVHDIMTELKKRDPDDLADDLETVLKSGAYVARHRALDILETVRAATDTHRTTVAISDLENATGCRGKMAAVRRLEKVAVGDRALQAFDDANLLGCKVKRNARATIADRIERN